LHPITGMGLPETSLLDIMTRLTQINLEKE
jgi:hypothetical protein